MNLNIMYSDQNELRFVIITRRHPYHRSTRAVYELINRQTNWCGLVPGSNRTNRNPVLFACGCRRRVRIAQEPIETFTVPLELAYGCMFWARVNGFARKRCRAHGPGTVRVVDHRRDVVQERRRRTRNNACAA